MASRVSDGDEAALKELIHKTLHLVYRPWNLPDRCYDQEDLKSVAVEAIWKSSLQRPPDVKFITAARTLYYQNIVDMYRKSVRADGNGSKVVMRHISFETGGYDEFLGKDPEVYADGAVVEKTLRMLSVMSRAGTVWKVALSFFRRNLYDPKFRASDVQKELGVSNTTVTRGKKLAKAMMLFMASRIKIGKPCMDQIGACRKLLQTRWQEVSKMAVEKPPQTLKEFTAMFEGDDDAALLEAAKTQYGLEPDEGEEPAREEILEAMWEEFKVESGIEDEASEEEEGAEEEGAEEEEAEEEEGEEGAEEEGEEEEWTEEEFYEQYGEREIEELRELAASFEVKFTKRTPKETILKRVWEAFAHESEEGDEEGEDPGNGADPDGEESADDGSVENPGTDDSPPAEVMMLDEKAWKQLIGAVNSVKEEISMLKESMLSVETKTDECIGMMKASDKVNLERMKEFEKKMATLITGAVDSIKGTKEDDKKSPPKAGMSKKSAPANPPKKPLKRGLKKK